MQRRAVDALDRARRSDERDRRGRRVDDRSGMKRARDLEQVTFGVDLRTTGTACRDCIDDDGV